MPINSLTPPSSFIDLLLDAVCIVDAEGRFLFASAACERIFGYTPQEMLGRPMIELVAPEDRERTLQAAAEIMAGQPKPMFENRYIRKDGEVVHIMWSARWCEAEQVRIAVARDITERKRAEAMQAALYAISEAAHAVEDLVSLFQRIHHIIGDLLPAQNFSVALYDERSGQLSFPYMVDEQDNGPAQRYSAAGVLCGEVVRTGLPLLVTPATAATLREDLRAVIGADALCWLGVPLSSPRGTIGALVLKSYAGGARYTGTDRELLQFVSNQVATAIERRRLYGRLQHAANFDELTDLPNRGLMFDRLDTGLARSRRGHGHMALLYVDLDKFKQVNDTHGHAVGDLLLKEVAARLKACVRDTDTVARVGGDEFVVLLESTHVPRDALAVAGKIHSGLAQPLELDGCQIDIAASIGIALYPEHGIDAQQLLKHADQAMYAAKKQGRGADCPAISLAAPGS